MLPNLANVAGQCQTPRICRTRANGMRRRHTEGAWMPAQITMPQQSDTMTEGTVVKWLKKEGDKVTAGDPIAEVETDKAVMEMEAFESGTLAAIVVPEGQKVPVGAVLGLIATGSEKPEDVKKQAPGAGQRAPAAAARGKPEAGAAAAPTGAP